MPTFEEKYLSDITLEFINDAGGIINVNIEEIEAQVKKKLFDEDGELSFLKPHLQVANINEASLNKLKLDALNKIHTDMMEAYKELGFKFASASYVGSNEILQKRSIITDIIRNYNSWYQHISQKVKAKILSVLG